MFDENVLSELTQMGFPPEACKRAIFFTKNQGLNDASNWLMEHISDSDFSDPFTPPGTETKSGGWRVTFNFYVFILNKIIIFVEFSPNEEAAAMIMSMGFERNHVISALKATENNLDRALDWIMSHGPEETNSTEATESSQPKYRDGRGSKF